MTRPSTKAILTGAAAVFLLAGCQAVRSAPERLLAWRTPPVEPAPGLIEPVRAAAVVNDLAVFRVPSNGCTKKDDMLPVVSRQGLSSVLILRRLTEDLCTRPVEDGVELRWTFEELGIKPGSTVTVGNPYQLPTGGT